MFVFKDLLVWDALVVPLAVIRVICIAVAPTLAIFLPNLIIVIDEPTAALDPIAELELYLAYNEMVGNKTSTYISNRMSSTRFCDRIVLLADREIQETGEHDQLMACCGL